MSRGICIGVCIMAYDGSLKYDTRIDLGGFNKGMAAITASIGGGIAAAVKFGSEFEQSFAKASTLFGDAKVNTAELKSEMLKLSSATGVAGKELNEALYSALSASIPATDDMSEALGVLESSTKLAKAGFTDIDTALSATAKTINAYGMAVSEADKIQGILIQTQNKGITTVGELGAHLSQVTPTAAAFGVSFENVGAALATMTAQGTNTAQATTQLNSLIAELGKKETVAQKNLTAAAKGSKYAGQSFKEMMENGADLGDVLKLMDDYAKKNGVSLVDMFSSIEAGKAALSVATQNGEKFTDNLKAMSDTSGVVESAYERVTDTLKEKTNILKENAKNLGVTFFEGISEPLKDATDTGIEALGRVTQSMNSGELKGAITMTGDALGGLFSTISNGAETVLPGLISGVGLLAGGLTTIAPFIPTVATGILAYNGAMKIATTTTAAFNAISSMTFNPAGLVIAGVAALGVGIYSVAQASKQAREEYFKMGEDVEAAANAFSEAKSKSEVTNEHINSWRELKTAISEGKIPAQELEAAQAKLKEHENWFIDNYGDYITAEEEKNGVRAETVDLIKQAVDGLTKQKELELKDEISETGVEIPGLKDNVAALEAENAEMEKQNQLMMEKKIQLQSMKNEVKEWVDSDEYDPSQYDAKFTELLGKYPLLAGEGYTCITNLQTAILHLNDDIEKNNNKITENTTEITNGKESIKQFDDAVKQLTVSKLGDDIESTSNKFTLLSKAIGESSAEGQITKSTLDALIKIFPELADAADKPAAITEKFNELKGSIQKAYGEVDALGINLEDLPEDVSTLFKLTISKNEAPQAVVETVTQATGDAKKTADTESPTIGKAIDDGVVVGLQSGQGAVNAAAGAVVDGALAEMRARADINSPAGETEKDGKFWDLGLAKGLEDNAGVVSSAGVTVVDTALNIMEGTISKSTLEQSLSKKMSSGFSEAVESAANAFGKKLKVIDKALSLGVISEKEYYSELEKLRDKYFTKDNEEWYEYTQRILEFRKNSYKEDIKEKEDHYQKLFDIATSFGDMTEEDELKFYRDRIERYKSYAEEVKNAEHLSESERFELISGFNDKIVEDTLSAYGIVQNKLDEYTQKRQQLASNLSDFGGLFDEIKIEGTDYSFFKLSDTKSMAAVVKNYQRLLNEVKALDDGSAGFDMLYNEILSLPRQDAIKLMSAIVNENNISGFLEGLTEIAEISADAAGEAYSEEMLDDLESLKTSFAENGYGGLPDSFFDCGKLSGQEFSAAFMEEFQKMIAVSSAKLKTELSATSPSTGTVVSNSYSPTYNIQPSQGESTQAQLKAAHDYETLTNARGGYL